jgi:hypothetical protein
MEVHHHAHTSRKKWTHYFWEFVMLFLAVFCGFLAEYQLEHKIEKDREKQYIRSYAEDLAADTAEINRRIELCNKTISAADSLTLLLRHSQKEKFGTDIYYFFRSIHRSEPFMVNDRTIVQLRNAGGMRLVSNKNVSDSMINYYKDVDFLKWMFEEQTAFKRSLLPHFNEILYAEGFNKVIDEESRVIRPLEILKLKLADDESLNTLMLILSNIKGINRAARSQLLKLKEKAIKIRKYINKEYQME